MEIRHNVDFMHLTRPRVCVLLQWQLSDASDLSGHARHIRGNVRPTSWFRTVHAFFDDVEYDISWYVGVLAQRILALGGIVEGVARNVWCQPSVESVFDPYDTGFALTLVARRVKRTVRTNRGAMEEAYRLDDVETANLLAAYALRLDKTLKHIAVHVRVDRHAWPDQRVADRRRSFPRH